MTGDYPRILEIADLSHFYILFTDGQTDGRTDRLTLVLVKSLSRLKSIHLRVDWLVDSDTSNTSPVEIFVPALF